MKVLDYDIVIIGSGAGGGTVASELSELCSKGVKIALLEWGGEFRKEDNNREEITMAKKYYFDYGGVQNKSQDVTFAFARAIGGSTTVYTGTSLVAPESVFKKWSIPGINSEDMAPRYEKYKTQNNVHLNPSVELNDNNRLFAEGCRELKWKFSQFPVNTRNCQGLGTCNLGCSILAKQGTHVVQIPNAKKNGVHVYPFAKAQKIKDHEVEVKIIPAEHGLEPGPLAPGDYIFRAKRIVVSAGAVNSPALLMRSFGENFLPSLGRYFTCHPALILVADHGRKIENVQGHPKSYFCDEFLDSGRYLLETCMYFPFVLAKNLNGYGEELDDLMSNYHQLQMILALIKDRPLAHNRITLSSTGEPEIHYQLDEENIEAFVGAIRASTRIFFAAGAKRVHAPAMEKFFITKDEAHLIDELISTRHFKTGKIAVAAAHLMGGCRMGSDINTSVTNEWGKVHGLEHVYVADASLFPAPSEVNPYLTIMSLADRVAQKIKEEILYQ